MELDGALAGAALFLAIVDFCWPTRGGRQFWDLGSQQVEHVMDLHPVDAQAKAIRFSRWESN
jgi:hypothetical protein